MFRESADAYISESLRQMDATDKKQVAEFIAMQAAYKRARQMKASVKTNALTSLEVVAIVRKVRKQHAAGKK